MLFGNNVCRVGVLIRKLVMVGCYVICFPTVHGQPTLSTAQIKTLHGAMVQFSTATQKDSLILVCFWATTSEQSITELNAINAKFDKWKEGLSFKLMAVAIDEGNTASRVRGLVNMNEWKFDVYTDIHGELRQALNSNNLPQSMIIKKNKVIYQQSGYEPGTEDYLYRRMRAIAEGKE